MEPVTSTNVSAVREPTLAEHHRVLSSIQFKIFLYEGLLCPIPFLRIDHFVFLCLCYITLIEVSEVGQVDAILKC